MKFLCFSILLLGAAVVLPAAQRYQGRGLVLKVDERERSVTISEESIPGFMDAMVMSYRAGEGQDLHGLKSGDMVEFTLTIENTMTSISSIRVIAWDSVEREPLEARSLAILQSTLDGTNNLSRGPAIGQRIPDFTLTDQTTKRVSMSSFSGKVVAITFVYTRCPLPDYCLRLSNNFGRLQKRFSERMGSDLVLLSITFDPAHDTPEVLARYGEIWKADPRGWHLLTGSVNQVKRVSTELGSNFWPDEGTFTHSLHTLVIDRQGKLVANIEGNRFTAEELGDLIQTLF